MKGDKMYNSKKSFSILMISFLLLTSQLYSQNTQKIKSTPKTKM